MRTILAAVLLAGNAQARTLTAGDGQMYASPSAAAAFAQDGDVIQVAPGEYFDCVATSRSITIQGPATLTDKACEGKAILVLKGADSVVRDLTLARARVPDGNGAGIRLEARNATIERVRFDNNEVAVLGGSGLITLSECNITAGSAGLIAILVGDTVRLELRNTQITITHGSMMLSSAALTTITGGTFDTADRGIELNGPATLTGPNVILRGAATVFARATADGVTIRRARLTNLTGRPVALLQDWSPGRPVLDLNQIGPGDHLVTTDGAMRHRIASALRNAKDGLRDLARSAKHAIMGP